ncbi:hypothetical protein P59_249 [Bacillus phage P59]|nr:hypothetical protein P59_020 [Bacillus phage P59]QIW88846.1 hypothetical protein P59_249 [Bacillus phage P59]
MKLLKIEHEDIKGTWDGKEYDFDRYNVEMRSPMATHEYSVVVDHLNKQLSGDCIRYGSWDDLIPEEVKEILDIVEAEGHIKRPYKDYKFI